LRKMLNVLKNIRLKLSVPPSAVDYNELSVYQNLLSDVTKDIKTVEGKRYFHSLLINALRQLSKKSDSQILLAYHHRRNKNQWILAKNETEAKIAVTGQLEFLSDHNTVYHFKDNDPLLSKLTFNPQGGKVKRGLVFQFFNEYDYIILSAEQNAHGLKYIEVITPLVLELKNRLELHQQQNDLKIEVHTLRTQLSQSDLKLRKTEKSLKKRVYEINNLLEISSELYSILNLDQLLNSSLLTIVGQIGCQKSFALLFDQKTNSFSRNFSKGFLETEKPKLDIEVDNILIKYLQERRRPLLIKDIQKTPDLNAIAEEFNTRQIELIAPLISSNRVRGIVGCGNKLYGSFLDASDLQIFTILVNIIAVSISNAIMYEDVKKMSFTDAMTSLNNYRYFENRLREEINRARRNKGCVSLIMLDIDFFKNYNDTLGHQAGDEALRVVGWILRNSVRDEDVVNRYGGEEFGIILPGLEKSAVHFLAERIRVKMHEHPIYKEYIQPGGSLTVSLGGASFPDDAENFENLVARADHALYQSKENGRNRFTLFQSAE